MPYARHLQLQTLDFMLGDTAPLARETALLAMAAAMTADGHAAETANVLSYVVGQHPDPEQVREIIVQTHLFCGYPRALNALEGFRKAVEKHDLQAKLRREAAETVRDDRHAARGKELWGTLYGNNAARIAEHARDLSPDLAAWSSEHGYGAVLSRPGVAPLDRSYCIIAALIMMDVHPQLKGHLQGALNLGATKEQLWALMGVVRKLFEADKLLHAAEGVFETVIGKKPMDVSFEEERKLRW